MLTSAGWDGLLHVFLSSFRAAEQTVTVSTPTVLIWQVIWEFIFKMKKKMNFYNVFFILSEKCQPKNLTGLMIGTTNISLNSELICTLSTDNKAQNNSLTDLFPGNVYEVNFACLNCCKNITTSKYPYLFLSSRLLIS